MATAASIPDWHVLDFFCDDAGSSALAVLVRGFRFHIIADKDKLSTDSAFGKRYDELVEKLSFGEKVPKSSVTPDADPKDTDSGVDVNDGERSQGKEEKVDPDDALQRFLLEPLADELNKLSESEEEETLQEWYNGPTYFYNLETSSDNDGGKAALLSATTDLTVRMQKLKPSMILAKASAHRLDVPIYSASALTVISTSDQPPGTPYHPCRVRHNDTGEVFFLKINDNNQPAPMKRELDILNQALNLKLNREINIPSLLGLVEFDDMDPTQRGQRRIMGFLQTDIPSAQPLTTKLDPSIPQEKRERLAKEADHAKEVLHKHGIVWGDAKADNFVVDGEEKLWIIDFGGSFTEGWVDERLKETEEGDDMGTGRVVSALEDPEGCTYDPDEDEGGEGEGGEEREEVTFSPDRVGELKRKRRDPEDDEEEDVEEGGSGKARKQG